jgi:hypothetical protein
MALETIYYPYSRSLSSLTLKKAALLFDTLYFLDCEPWFIRRLITHQKQAGLAENSEASDIEHVYQLLKDQGIVRVIDAHRIVQENDDLLTVNVVNDISDDEFCRLASPYSADVWSILRDRIPPSLLKTLYPGAGTFSESISLQALINADGDISRISNEHDKRFAEFRWGAQGLTRDQALEIFLGARGYRYVIGGNPHIDLPSYEFPFLQASSLRINECLIVAALNDYVPFTDSAIHDTLLRSKVSRVLVAVDSQPELKRRLSIDLPVKFPAQSIALEILDRIIPENALGSLSVEDLLWYRARNAKLLARFHSYLDQLAAEVEGVTPEDDYEKKVKKLVSARVLAEIQKARDDLASSYENAFGGIVAPSAVAATSTVIATLFSGLSLWHVLLAGAVAEGAVLVSKSPDALIQAWKGRRVSGRSPLAYLAGVST